MARARALSFTLLALLSCAASGCRLLAAEALPCDRETDCPYPYGCVDGRCALPLVDEGRDAGRDAPRPDGGVDRVDAGLDGDDAGPLPADAGALDVDAGGSDVDAGLPIGPDCDGPGAVREDFSGDLSRWAMSSADGTIALGADAALHVAPAAGVAVNGGMTTFLALDEQGLRARVAAIGVPPPADGFFKVALRALAADPIDAFDRIELQWSGDALRANLEVAASDAQIGASLVPYDALAYPIWRIRRVGGEVVVEVADEAEAQVVEVARAPLPPTLWAGAPSFQANGGTTGFEVAVDDINTFAAAQPLCPLASMPDSFADGALEPELAVVEQLNGCTASESGGQLRFHIDAALDDTSCRVVSRRSFSLANSSITLGLTALALRMDGSDPPASHMTFGVELAIDGAVQLAGGLDARTLYCSAPTYANTGAPLTSLPSALRLREQAGVLHCEILDDNGAVLSDLPQDVAAPVERVTPILFVRGFDALPEAVDLGVSILASP